MSRFQSFGKIIPPHIYLDIQVCGFVYLITNPINSKFYVGKKSFRGGTDWQRYTGSCKPLAADMKKVGKDKFIYEVLDYAANQRDLTLKECYWQIHFDVLNREDSYNQQILGKFFKNKLDIL